MNLNLGTHEALDKLVTAGWLTEAERDQMPYVYETTPTGMG